MPDLSQLLEVCRRAAQAGCRILHDWRGKAQVWEKGPADLVTQADLAAQKEIESIVVNLFPEHAFLGEESGKSQIDFRPGRLCWIVDPLDGTTNYVHGLPGYAVSIAVADGEQMLAGNVLDAMNGEDFWAQRGGGAFLGETRLAASKVESLDRALVAVSLPPRVDRDSLEVHRLLEILMRAQAIRRLGSAALNLAYVAAGRLDAYYATAVKPWDVAAGVLLVQEAGGVVRHVDGGPFSLARPLFVAAANERLADELIAALALD